jgi:protein SCO1/2
MKELGAKANDVQVLFVTVDPERDTPELLAQYVPAFNPGFLGLRGSPAELETVTKLFKVFYQKNPSPSGGYTMDHTAGSFVFDKQGRARVLIPYGAGVSVFAHDLSQLLK